MVKLPQNPLISAGAGLLTSVAIDFAVEQFHIPILNDKAPIGTNYSNTEVVLYGIGAAGILSTREIGFGSGLMLGTALYENILSVPLRSTV